MTAMRELQVRDCMTPQPHLIRAKESVAEAKELMDRFKIRHLPVVDLAGKPVGMLSERDVNLVCGLEGIAPNLLVVMDVSHGKPYVVAPRTPMREVAEQMAKTRYGSAIVVDDRQIIGILTTVDVCRTLALVLAGRRPESA